MRSKIIWGSVVLMLALLTGIASTYMVERLIADAQDITVKIFEAIDDSDEQAALERLTELATLWESRKSLMEMLVSHEDLHNVATQCALAKAQIEDGDFSNFMLAITEMTEMLEHLKHQETLSLSNIL